MPRKPRLCAPNLCHHVVHRGIDRQNIYLDAGDRYLFLSILRTACRETSARIVAYCLMGNHFHLLIEDCQGRLSRLMQTLNGTYTLAFNRRHQREGALLRGRYFSRALDDEKEALTVLRYIHLNPVKAQMVTVPSSYIWSSALAYLDGRPSRNVTSALAFSLFEQSGIYYPALDTWTLDPESDSGCATKLPVGLLCAGSIETRLEAEHIVGAEQYLKRTEEAAYIQRCKQTIASRAQMFGLPAESLVSTGKKICSLVTLARYHAILACIDELRATHAQVAHLFGLKHASVGNVVARARRLLSMENCRKGSDPLVGGEGFEPSEEKRTSGLFFSAEALDVIILFRLVHPDH